MSSHPHSPIRNQPIIYTSGQREITLSAELMKFSVRVATNEYSLSMSKQILARLNENLSRNT